MRVLNGILDCLGELEVVLVDLRKVRKILSGLLMFKCLMLLLVNLRV